MKQIDNMVLGDAISVASYTSGWHNVRVHPLVFYRRSDEFDAGFTKVKGLVAVLDLGQHVSIRFSDKCDLTAFHRIHHEYV